MVGGPHAAAAYQRCLSRTVLRSTPRTDFDPTSRRDGRRVHARPGDGTARRFLLDVRALAAHRRGRLHVGPLIERKHARAARATRTSRPIRISDSVKSFYQGESRKSGENDARAVRVRVSRSSRAARSDRRHFSSKRRSGQRPPPATAKRPQGIHRDHAVPGFSRRARSVSREPHAAGVQRPPGLTFVGARGSRRLDFSSLIEEDSSALRPRSRRYTANAC